MNKKKIVFFVLGNALAGAFIVIIAIVNVFALQGTVYIVVSVLSIIAGGLMLYLLSSWTAKKEYVTYISGIDPDTSLNSCRSSIESYLRKNKSTPFFREKLTSISERLNTFGLRCDNIKDVIIKRFGSTGLSYVKFAAPVNEMKKYLVNLVNNFISKLRVFNEAEYSLRIGEFIESNRMKDAADYRKVEQIYKDYAEKTLVAFDDAILKLDKLSLEISKLGDADVDKAMNIMRDLDSAIKDIKLYE